MASSAPAPSSRGSSSDADGATTPGQQTRRNIRLVYFDFGGRAEAIRLALHVGGVDFEDVRITEDQFRQEKAGACSSSL